MKSVLIDITYLRNKYNPSVFFQHIYPIPTTTGRIGVVLVLTDKNMKILKHHRIKCLNSTEFMSEVISFGFLSYDQNSGRCVLEKSCKGMVKQVVDCTMRYVPNNTILVANTTDNAFREELISLFFTDDNVNPLTRLNDVFFYDYNNLTNRNKYIYNSSNISNIVCSYSYKLTPKTVDYLKTLPFSGTTRNNDGTLSQKEFAGSMVTKFIDDNLVHHLSIENRPHNGGEKNVSNNVELVTFHSHPESAYDDASVKYGFPSIADYTSFLTVESLTNVITHMVSCIEGIYFISVPSEFIESGYEIDSSIRDLISDSGVTDKNNGMSPTEHAIEMSKLTINGKRFVTVTFLNWENSNSIIKINYRKENGICKIPKT